ncbi:response regulator [Aeoliella mucimassa]|uniref:Chemotaxis response regulator protein-glutamate methylesterase n=1 Tax=Aeoliella mucimassa TaxID=2527972 RepID=A0A518ARC0_9BACT|nr:response regulator [Aeoliella mucimassa]QDU57268.1 Chemotaxis response regulator protein-glutamate methylesterase [Aeoliella mucimassa]
MPSDHVLIVDQSSESREVLTALLARTGALTIEASRACDALSLAEQHRPQLIVLDTDSDSTSNREATRALTAAARRNNTPIVLLGKIAGQEVPQNPSDLLPKPYHYRHLIRRIEDVLEQRRAA